ncbi:MAG: hypothetical protein SGILL_002804 [Bacillariaceae sp.]
MATDPRRRSTRSSAILLAGDDDAMEEDEDLFDEPMDSGPPQGSQDMVTGQVASVPTDAHMDLISTIITPSPFPHHTTGPTSSRYRNALQRITAHPLKDTEAWQALFTEVSTCWKSLQTTKNIHALDAETQLQLDWIESCYGSLLKYFPYSCSNYVAIGEILFVLSAQVGEEGGPAADYGGLFGKSQRVQQAQAKLQTILREALGFDLDGNAPEHDQEATTATVGTDGAATTAGGDGQPQNRKRKILSVALGGICTSSVELWLLYIKTRIRHARRKYGYHTNIASQNVDAAKAILEESKKAYELAVEHAGFTCFDNHILWKEYLMFCKSQVPPPLSEQERNASLMVMTPQQHMLWLRSIYQKLVCHPMTDLDQLWQEYEIFERQQSEALASALIQELQPKYQHARNVYLERRRVFSVQDLEWKSRFSTPPVASRNEDDDGTRGSGGGTGGVGGDSGKGKSDDLGGGDGEETVQEYTAKMQGEFDYLTKWKKRCAFERTNPERLTSPQELAHRVRQAYKEMMCVLTLYPEAWHMWSTYEDTVSSENSNKSIAVLQLGEGYIPDSAVLAQAHAALVEIHAARAGADTSGENGSKKPEDSSALGVLERYLERAPTSLGFCLYQRLVRRYKGKEAARAVFAKARRILSQGTASVELSVKSSVLGLDQKQSSGGNATDDDLANGGNGAGENDNGTSTGKRWLVTNRLDPTIASSDNADFEGVATKPKSMSESTNANIVARGPVTWHLYACHASIEHRLNKSPDIAARIYELGLRRHASFLTKPSYVLKYAELLMELQDTVNLRALLTRALAACGDSKKSEQIETLWNMTLQCEEMWSILDPTNLEVAASVERRRRAALLGPDIEDVATGSRVGMGDSAEQIGSQKSTLAEQLIRNDGYETSSRIVNGLGRAVDVLDIIGLWGDGTAGRQYINRLQNDESDEVIPGGKSDHSYQRRLQFARRLAAGISFDATSSFEAGSKLLSARERLQGGTPGFQNTPIQMAIQQMPDWLRGMALILPASRLRSSIVPKAPPHLIEMALSSLRQSKLPAERPKDEGGASGSHKRPAAGGGGDSSDEEGPRGSGGYGSTFRARQRARIANN